MGCAEMMLAMQYERGEAGTSCRNGGSVENIYRLSQGGKEIFQMSGQWGVKDGLQRWGEMAGYRCISLALKEVEILVCG